MAASPDAPALPLPRGASCPQCGYDLRGSTSERCSECGRALHDLRQTEPLVPWARRKELGSWRAYWRTVELVTRRPKTVALDVVRPVNYGDTQRFRWVTFAIVCVALAGVAGDVALEFTMAGEAPAETLARSGAALVCAVLWLAGLPGVASYVHASRRVSLEYENRALALSYYAVGPSALLWVPLPFIWAGRLCGLRRDLVDAEYTLIVIAGLLTLTVITLAIRARIVLFNRLVVAGRAWKLIRLAVFGLLALAYAVVVTLGALSVVYVVLIVRSLL